jgi:hypothetical protein
MSDMGEVIVNSLARVLERLIEVNRHVSNNNIISKYFILFYLIIFNYLLFH